MALKLFRIPLLITFSILCIPLVLMQFTEEVKWGIADFLVGGILLFSVTLGVQLLWHSTISDKYKLLIGLSLMFLFILIWMELAVGVFGSPFGGL